MGFGKSYDSEPVTLRLTFPCAHTGYCLLTCSVDASRTCSGQPRHSRRSHEPQNRDYRQWRDSSEGQYGRHEPQHREVPPKFAQQALEIFSLATATDLRPLDRDRLSSSIVSLEELLSRPDR